MVDRVAKALRKLNERERRVTKKLLQMIKAGRVNTLDIKRFKGNSSVYRVRKGSMRVLYQVTKSGSTKILAIERRSDTTYKKF